MLRGSIDFVDHLRARGWAQDEASPHSAVKIAISVNREVVGQATANQFRDDLKEAGIGNGWHSFEYVFPASLLPNREYTIEFRSADGELIPGSPVTLQPLKPAETAATGNLDYVDHYRIAGWSQYEDRPDEQVTLIVTVNEKLAGRVVANSYRADLAEAGIGDGRHAFDWGFIEPLSLLERQVIRVRRELDGMELRGSPVTLDPPADFDRKTRRALSNLLSRYARHDQIEDMTRFLADELNQLVQKKADADSNRVLRRRNRDLARRWGNSRERPVQLKQDQPRALVIDDRLPVLDRDAGSNAIVSHMRSMQRLGYEVSFVASSELRPPSGADSLSSLGVTLCSLPFYGSTEELLWRQAGEFDLIYMHRISNAAKYGELVRQHFPKARKIFSVADLHHVRLARQAEIEDRTELLPLANRLKFAEILAAASADAVITHSDYEADVLRKNLPKANIHRVLWSVDPKPTNVPFESRRGIAFIGGFDHAPNVDAAKWLMSSLMPQIRQILPEVHCYLVGSSFPPELEQMKPDGLIVMGQVASLSEIFDRVRLTVAPLSYGAGVKGKILESLAAGVPCVYTGVAAEGMRLPAELEACRGDDDRSISKAVKRLHEDAELNERCSSAGLRYVREELSEKKLDRSMQDVLVAGTARAAGSSAS